jgi:ribonuclease HI
MLVIGTDETHQPCDKPCPTGTQMDIPSVIEPLNAEVLAARREVILANRRARRATKPAYINTDASWQGGLAGLAYVGALGMRVELVKCDDNHEAEYLALLMAMGDADRCLLGRIAFRTDSQTVVNFQIGTAGQFEDLRKGVKLMLSRHPEWMLVLVEGMRNRTADELSRRPFKQLRKDGNAYTVGSRSAKVGDGPERA